MTPGNLLTEIINKHNIIQAELAELSGNSQPTIHRMMKDKQKMNYKLLKVLRKKYKVNVNQFFDLED
jgi:transcriptional regulator with XRE-family HTH domain